MAKNDDKEALKIRAYPLANHANEGKLAPIRELLPAWQEALVNMQRKLVRSIQQGEGLPQRIPLKPADLGFETVLTSRHINSVHTQARGALDSWQEILKIAVRETIKGSLLPTEIRIILFRANAAEAWFRKELYLPMSVNNDTGEFRHGRVKGKKWQPAEDLFVGPELLKLLRHMVKHLMKRQNPLPNLSRVKSIGMDGKVAQIERAEQGCSFDYWVRVSTLERGKPVRVPLKSNKRFKEATGEMGGFVQVVVRDSGEIQFMLQKKSEEAVTRPDNGKWLGLDFGMTALFATSDGRLLGQGCMARLQELDQQVTELGRALQRQNIPLKTNKRYQMLQHRMREYIKNEVNRVLNKVAKEDLAGLVVENLDFRGVGMSKTMNRLITRFGRSAIRKKLNSLESDYGLRVEKVNPAYTSQQCSGCNYVDKKNRSNRKFLCRFCGKKTHADVNGARTIKSRRSWLAQESSNTKRQRVSVRERLDDEFCTQWGLKSLPAVHATGRKRFALLADAA